MSMPVLTSKAWCSIEERRDERCYSALDTIENLKQADLLRGIGAPVLGTGIGALATQALGWFAVPLLLISCLSQGWIMIQKHRIEQLNASGSAAWQTALYWGCRAAIAIVLAIASWKALIHA